jgi:hypothetical protein
MNLIKYILTISCISSIAESLYGAVDSIKGISTIPISDEKSSMLAGRHGLRRQSSAFSMRL